MDDFENKLTEIHDRVLNNALTEEEQNNYTESLLNLSSILTNTGKNFGMQENCRLPLNILNGDDSMKL